jgi:hypothetical protein
MKKFFDYFMPPATDRVERARAALVLVTCGIIIFGMLLMIVFWVATGSLEEVETVRDAGILSLVLVGIAFLVRVGKIRLAAWSLVVILGGVTLLISVMYGVATLSSSGIVLSIILAAAGIGLWAGLMVAALGSAGMWAIAYAASIGAIQPWIEYEVSNLTFDAPFLTVLFLMVALMVGVYARRLWDEPALRPG